MVITVTNLLKSYASEKNTNIYKLEYFGVRTGYKLQGLDEIRELWKVSKLEWLFEAIRRVNSIRITLYKTKEMGSLGERKEKIKVGRREIGQKQTNT